MIPENDNISDFEPENFSFEDEFSDEHVPENDDGDEPLFTPSELQDLIAENSKSQIKTVYEKVINSFDKKESNVVKADEQSNISKYELNQILNYNNEQRKKDFYNPIKENIQYFESIEEQFKDFFELPKLSGNDEKLSDSNLIPHEIVGKTEKKVEISDDPHELEYDQRTTIEISRDENGDIESLIINCKCGERTFIRFDYDDGLDNATEVIQPKTKISSFKLEEIQITKKKNQQPD